MNPLLIGPLAELVKQVVGRIWPDPAAQADAQLKLAVMVQNGELAQLAAELELAKAQIEVNKIEAASTRFFVAGPRPFIMWVCGVAFAYKFILAPAAAFALTAAGHPITLPVLDFTEMSTVLLALLGIGGLRTVEKVRGVA